MAAALRLAFFGLVGLWLLIAPAFAQEISQEAFERWETLAKGAEETIDAERGSNDTFEALRVRIADFRGQFDAARDQNATRIATLREQLAALGPKPEGEGAPAEAADVAAKREELNDQLAKLLLPVHRAETAFVRADNLVGEIDRILRDRQARELLTVTPSPLNPVHWQPALTEFMRAVDGLWNENPRRGKEHSWDEGFGYFGAPAHTLKLTADQVYAIAKQKPEAMAFADYNKDGKVDLRSEMVFGPAYYAAGFDRTGKTDYLHGIMRAFVEGRHVIAAAKGEVLSAGRHAALRDHAATIEKLWQQVLAEAVFKYAGSVYKDMAILKSVLDANGDPARATATMVKHWGEMKGFALALQTGKSNLGETAVRLNRMIGFGPVMPNSSQVVDIDSRGNYVKDQASGIDEYMLHMLKVQKLMVDTYGIQARHNDVLSDLNVLADKLGSGNSAEND